MKRTRPRRFDDVSIRRRHTSRSVGNFKASQGGSLPNTSRTVEPRQDANNELGSLQVSGRRAPSSFGLHSSSDLSEHVQASKSETEPKIKKHRGRRIVKRVVAVTSLAIVMLVGVVGLKSWLTLRQVIDRGGDGAIALQGNIDPTSLKGEGDGRINVLMMGVGGDKHQAGELADSIIVASIDPFAKEMGMLSVPRDLYVSIPGYYKTRINAANHIGDTENHPGGGVALTSETLEEILGIPIHYYVKADFDGFIQAVDTVGGIDIDLDERVYDPNFDWEYGRGVLDLKPGTNHLDGITALMLARARGASGVGLGVSRGDFGRGDRQRDMLLALKSKVLSAGTYTNPAKIASLLDAVGGHVRTDMQIGEMLKLYEIVKDIGSEDVVSFGFDDGANNYLQSANIAGAAVLVPRSGDFSDIKSFVRSLFVDGFIRQEQATLSVLNGTTTPGLAKKTTDELSDYGYNIIVVANALEDDYVGTKLYVRRDAEKPYTRQLLENRLGVLADRVDDLSDISAASSGVDFVIIVGQQEEDTIN